VHAVGAEMGIKAAGGIRDPGIRTREPGSKEVVGFCSSWGTWAEEASE